MRVHLRCNELYYVYVLHERFHVSQIRTRTPFYLLQRSMHTAVLKDSTRPTSLFGAKERLPYQLLLLLLLVEACFDGDLFKGVAWPAERRYPCSSAFVVPNTIDQGDHSSAAFAYFVWEAWAQVTRLLHRRWRTMCARSSALAHEPMRNVQNKVRVDQCDRNTIEEDFTFVIKSFIKS